MSLGNVLIRPQLLDRRPLDSDAQVVDLLTALSSRLIEDLLRGGPATEKIVAACKQSITGFVASVEPRLVAAGGKLENWVKPYLDIIKAAPTPAASVAGFTSTSEFVFRLAHKVLDDVHTEPLVGRLNGLADIVENDFGLTREGFENLFLSILDNIETKLSTDFLNGSQSDVSINNFLLSVQIRSARRRVRQLMNRFPMPELNLRELIRDVQLRLEREGWNAKLDEAKTQLTDIEHKITDLLPTLSDVFQFNVSTRNMMARDIGENPGQYAWYASWFTGEPTRAANRFSYAGSPEATQIKFNVFPIELLEHWVHITKVLSEVVTAIFHGVNMSEGNRVSPLLNLINKGAMGIMSFISAFVDNQSWAGFMKVKENSLFQTGFTEGLTLAGSFENINGFWTWLWAFWQADRAEANGGNEILEWAETINEAVLSIMTLINADNEAETENQDKFEGLTELFGKITEVIIVPKLGEGERYHALTDNFGRTTVTYLIGGGILFGSKLVGWLIGGAFSRRISVDYWEAGKSREWTEVVGRILSGENAYGAFLYAFKDFHSAFDLEGETDEGKYGLKQIVQANGEPQFVKAEFAGYPSQSTSPYLLPFANTEGVVFCSQTHRGRSSHNNYTGLIYAVDFILNRGNIVLAMRGGVVVDFNDEYPNGSDSRNFIIIQHDDDQPNHDIGIAGQRVTTYAHYENGETFSIRRAFAAMGVSSDNIIGRRIQQGSPLMILSKRSGFFEFDHLQVHVSAAITEGVLSSIPFVFKDINDKGIPEKAKYYVSQNTLKIPAEQSVYQPDYYVGLIESSGVDFVVLDNRAADSEAAYVGTHLLISYPLLEDGGTTYEFKKITSYESGNRKAFITGSSWSHNEPPPKGATCQIGARPFSQAGVLDKSNVFLSNGTTDLASGRPPFKLMASNRLFFDPLLTGTILGGGILGSREVHIPIKAEIAEASLYRRHIIILRDGLPIQYRLIQSITTESGVHKLLIEGNWDIALQTGIGSADTYMIGARPYYLSNTPYNQAFLAPDTPKEAYHPQPFFDKKAPYTYSV